MRHLIVGEELVSDFGGSTKRSWYGVPTRGLQFPKLESSRASDPNGS